MKREGERQRNKPRVSHTEMRKEKEKEGEEDRRRERREEKRMIILEIKNRTKME